MKLTINKYGNNKQIILSNVYFDAKMWFNLHYRVMRKLFLWSLCYQQLKNNFQCSLVILLYLLVNLPTVRYCGSPLKFWICFVRSFSSAMPIFQIYIQYHLFVSMLILLFLKSCSYFVWIRITIIYTRH